MRPRTHYSEEAFTVMKNRVRSGVVRTRTESIGSQADMAEGQDRLAAKTSRTPGQRPSDAVPVGSMPVIGKAGLNLASSPFFPYRSKLERAWANYLQGLVMLGQIDQFWYEPVNIRLPGTRNFYKPDFLVWDYRHDLIFYEVKGRNPSDDRSLVKMKTAAGITPWAKFVLVKRIRGQWEERVIS